MLKQKVSIEFHENIFSFNLKPVSFYFIRVVLKYLHVLNIKSNI
jgi:hypothetical protein